jgi:hypothetical protein
MNTVGKAFAREVEQLQPLLCDMYRHVGRFPRYRQP